MYVVWNLFENVSRKLDFFFQAQLRSLKIDIHHKVKLIQLTQSNSNQRERYKTDNFLKCYLPSTAFFFIMIDNKLQPQDEKKKEIASLKKKKLFPAGTIKSTHQVHIICSCSLQALS